MLLDVVHTRGQKSTGLAWECVEYVKLCVKSLMMWTCWNNLGFSLYVASSVCHLVAISENWMDSEVRVSADVSVLLLNTGD